MLKVKSHAVLTLVVLTSPDITLASAASSGLVRLLEALASSILLLALLRIAAASPLPLDYNGEHSGNSTHLEYLDFVAQYQFKPTSPNSTMTVIVHEGKTGSSSIRSTMAAQQQRAGAYCVVGYSSGRSSDDKFNTRTKVCHQDAVLAFGGGYGTCDYFEARGTPCRYVVTLRDPILRAVSAYNYFCLLCKDNKKYCKKEVLAKGVWNCPNMPFTAWAQKMANQFTFHFSHKTKPSGHISYFREVFAGNISTDESSFSRARTALSSGSVLVLLTETLSITGWRELDVFLGRPGFNTSKYEKTSNVHSYSSYTPNAKMLAKVSRLNKYDVRLYEEFARQRPRVVLL